MQKKHVIVIGAGMGGLSSAALLAKEGYSVTVIEKNNHVGGRAKVLKEHGFTFDMGPSWYMMPDIYDEYFSRFGKKKEAYFSATRLDPSYRVYFKNDTYFDISADLEKNIALFESIEPGAGEKLKSYIKVSKYKYDTAVKLFLYKSYKNPLEFFNKQILFEGPRLKIFKKYSEYVAGFFKNVYLQKLSSWMITFLGASPENAPALYSLISYADYGLGIWYPKTGLGDIPQALYTLGKEYGVEFIFNEEVKHIEVLDGNVSSVETVHKKYSADYVIANADYAHVETKLLEKSWQTYPAAYWEKKTYSPSCLLFYIGLDTKLSDKFLHHTMILSGEWAKHFESIYTDKVYPPENPLYYVNVPSKTDPHVAPEGGECITVLIPVAPGLEDTQEIRDKFYRIIVKKLEELEGSGLEEHIVFKKDYCINDFAQDYNAYKGNAFGLAHTLFQSAVFRPSIQSKKVQNLFYASYFSNPGVGMPLTVIAGIIAAEEIIKNNEASK